MDATRTDWPDWRVDRLSGDVERLRKELADMREQEWKKRARQSRLIGNAILFLAWMFVIVEIVLVVASPG